MKSQEKTIFEQEFRVKDKIIFFDDVRREIRRHIFKETSSRKHNNDFPLQICYTKTPLHDNRRLQIFFSFLLK